MSVPTNTATAMELRGSVCRRRMKESGIEVSENREAAEDFECVGDGQLTVSVWIGKERLFRSATLTLDHFQEEDHILDSQRTVAVDVSAECTVLDVVGLLEGTGAESIERLHLTGSTNANDERTQHAGRCEPHELRGVSREEARDIDVHFLLV